MSLKLNDRILLALYTNLGSRTRELADEIGISRRDVNSELYGELSTVVEKDDDHKWWPKPLGNGREEDLLSFQRKAALLAGLKSCLHEVPRELSLTKPLDLKLQSPLSPRLRFYDFPLKLPKSRGQRAYINLTIGGSADPGLRTFDRSAGFRPMIVGYLHEDNVFALWDTDVYERGGGFKYNRFCMVGVSTLFRAVATGVAVERRQLRKPVVTETVVTCRQDTLVSALEKRQSLTFQRIIDSES